MGESLKEYSPLALAYLGDAVYERHVREYLLHRYGNIQVEKYHKLATKFVRADAQAKAVTALLERFDEAEEDIFRRARNARSHAAPKSASTSDYHRATGFEAVIGWLCLKKKDTRAAELMDAALEFLKEEA